VVFRGKPDRLIERVNENFEPHTHPEVVGKEYYEFRAALLVRNNEGLTKTYNRFHDPNDCSPDIQRLRELHAAMDRAVLDAYGWTDLKPTHAFLLDYEEDEDEEEPTGRPRKKPWRYRWPDEYCDEVLAKLLELFWSGRIMTLIPSPPAGPTTARGRPKSSAGAAGIPGCTGPPAPAIHSRYGLRDCPEMALR